MQAEGLMLMLMLMLVQGASAVTIEDKARGQSAGGMAVEHHRRSYSYSHKLVGAGFC